VQSKGNICSQTNNNKSSNETRDTFFTFFKYTCFSRRQEKGKKLINILLVCSVVHKTGKYLESANYYNFLWVCVLYKTFPSLKETKNIRLWSSYNSMNFSL